MPPLKCPTPDLLLEFVSIPYELSWATRSGLRFHSLGCKKCQERISFIRLKWKSYFVPQEDITSSLIKVYSKLQNDETLILKGWKIGNYSHRRSFRHLLLSGGWIFRGAVGLGLSGFLLFLVWSQFRPRSQDPMGFAHAITDVPYARIRFEDKNRVRVHYVQPELIKSVEFETTSLR